MKNNKTAATATPPQRHASKAAKKTGKEPAGKVKVTITDEKGKNPRTVEIPTEIFTAFEKKAKKLKVTPSELLDRYVGEAVADSDALTRIEKAAGVSPERMQALQDKLGFSRADIHSIALASVVKAMEAQIAESNEVTLPLQWMPAHPKDLAPVFISSKTARTLRDLCEAADVDADFWCDELIGASVKDALRHTRTVEDGRIIFEGILGDFYHGHTFRPAEWAEAVPKFIAIIERERPAFAALDKQLVEALVSDITYSELATLAEAAGVGLEEYLSAIISRTAKAAHAWLESKGKATGNLSAEEREELSQHLATVTEVELSLKKGGAVA